MNYGYVRVSSKEQNLNRQYDALRTQYPNIIIFEDKATGKNFNRPGYKELLKVLKKGDVVFIEDIDRLGRDYKEIQKEWYHITKVIEAHISVLNMPLLDTRNSASDLGGMLIADLTLHIVSYMADRERTMIKQRQREGIEAAKRRGHKFGGQKKFTKEQFADYYETLCINQKLPRTQAAKIMGISYTTFSGYIKEYNEEHHSTDISE